MTKHATPSSPITVPLDLSDPRLSCPIHHLKPSSHGLQACEKLQVRTIADFLAHTEAEFLSQRDCAKRTYDELLARVHQFLAEPDLTQPGGSSDQRLLREVVSNPRAQRAFDSLGLRTVAEFLDTPKDRLLAVHGFGERTYWTVTQSIRELARSSGPRPSLLPAALLEFPLHRLALDDQLLAALQPIAATTIGELISAEATGKLGAPALGAADRVQLERALDQLVRHGTDHALGSSDNAACSDFAGFLRRLEHVLDAEQGRLFRLRLGLDGDAMELRQVAAQLQIDETAAHILEEHAKLSLRNRVPALLGHLRHEVETEINRHDGFVSGTDLAEGSLLCSAAEHSNDTDLPLRLVQFCLAHEYYRHGDMVTAQTPAEHDKLNLALRSATAPERLPVSLQAVAAQLARAATPAPTGLLIRLLEPLQALHLVDDPELGPTIRGSSTNPADRMFEILLELARPVAAEDILFHYRDRHQRGNLQTLLDHLRLDPRFLEVAHGVWSLRNKHLDELSAARPEADRIAETLLDQRGRQSVFRLHQASGLPERTSFMVIANLRHDPRVRYLGEGLFCQRSEKSAVMEEIQAAIRQAMGELVQTRFLTNHPPRRRRAMACVMQHNRTLVSPAPDRIDLLSNYPFNSERLERLREQIEGILAGGRGYATATALLSQINQCDLGGEWLTPHLFLDLLRRNTDFELLPGNIVAQRQLGLGGWIQHRARECLRRAESPLSPEGVLASDPELAGFSDSLHGLLQSDPMVQCVDGDRYAVI